MEVKSFLTKLEMFNRFIVLCLVLVFFEFHKVKGNESHHISIFFPTICDELNSEAELIKKSLNAVEENLRDNQDSRFKNTCNLTETSFIEFFDDGYLNSNHLNLSLIVYGDHKKEKYCEKVIALTKLAYELYPRKFSVNLYAITWQCNVCL